MSKPKREKLMSFEQIKEAGDRVAAKLENRENTDDVLELTLEELSAISGGSSTGSEDAAPPLCGSGCYKLV